MRQQQVSAAATCLPSSCLSLPPSLLSLPAAFQLLRWCGFSDAFRNEMVFPLTALFFGTGNQVPGGGRHWRACRRGAGVQAAAVLEAYGEAR